MVLLRPDNCLQRAARKAQTLAVRPGSETSVLFQMHGLENFRGDFRAPANLARNQEVLEEEDERKQRIAKLGCDTWRIKTS
jgi:hypothetical protein